MPAAQRVAVGREIRELRSFEGASGPVEFAGSRTGEARAVSVLRVSDLHVLAQVPSCVFVVRGSVPSPVC